MMSYSTFSLLLLFSTNHRFLNASENYSREFQHLVVFYSIRLNVRWFSRRNFQKKTLWFRSKRFYNSIVFSIYSLAFLFKSLHFSHLFHLYRFANIYLSESTWFLYDRDQRIQQKQLCWIWFLQFQRSAMRFVKSRRNEWIRIDLSWKYVHSQRLLFSKYRRILSKFIWCQSRWFDEILQRSHRWNSSLFFV